MPDSALDSSDRVHSKGSVGRRLRHEALVCCRLEDIAAFIEGRLDDRLIDELLWGLMLVNWRKRQPATLETGNEDTLPGACYALLKLSLARVEIRNISVPPVASIIRHGAAGHGYEATRVAARRLRASGLPPAIDVVHVEKEAARRAAAAVLFPLAQESLSLLAKAVLRTPQESTERPFSTRAQGDA